MKRFHVHVTVKDLEQSIRFYSTLFGAEPTRREADYAKWMLEDPRLNFAISQREEAGLSHLGFQAEDKNELEALQRKAEAASERIVVETDANCCYARSDKAWVRDPAGIAWENFYTHGTITTYGADIHGAAAAQSQAPRAAEKAPTCGTPTSCC